ncbi:hypothetical protein GC167_05310 [bacterium]|nr:hypothetical protein [bacterium]
MVLSLMVGSVHSQNHVPNSGFEVLDSCVTNQDQFERAFPWINLVNSADVFNTCVGDSCPVTVPWVCVPLNGRGHQ